MEQLNDEKDKKIIDEETKKLLNFLEKNPNLTLKELKEKKRRIIKKN